MTDRFKPGDEVYWWSEQVTIVRKGRKVRGKHGGQLWVVLRPASKATMEGADVHDYPEREQEILEHALQDKPNYALDALVADYKQNWRGAIPKLAVYVSMPVEQVREGFEFVNNYVHKERLGLLAISKEGRRMFYPPNGEWEDCEEGS